MEARDRSPALDRGVVTSFVLMAGGMLLLFGFHAVAARQLGTEEYGAFSYAHNYAALIASLVTLGWPLATMRFVTQYYEEQSWGLLRGVITHSSRAVFLLSLGASALLYLVSSFAAQGPDGRRTMVLIAILVPALAVGELQLRMLRGLRRVSASIIFERILLPALLLVGLLVLAVQDGARLVVAFAAIAGCVRVAAAVYTRRGAPAAAKSAVREVDLRQWYSVAGALALGEVGRAVLVRAGVAMLGPLAGLGAVGVYSAARRAAMPVTFTLAAVAAIAGPLLASAYHGNRREEFLLLLRRAAAWSVAGAVPVFLVVALAPRWLLGVFGEDYVDGAPVLIATAVGGMTSAAAGPATMALVLTGRERHHAAATGVAAVATVAVNAVAIPVWGAEGAAWGSTAVLACLNVWLHVQARRSAPVG